MSRIKEGKVTKGGVNPAPTTPKPSIKPPSQDLKFFEIGKPIMGNSARLFLELLTNAMSPWEGQHHNLTIDKDNNMILTMMFGECYWSFALEESDLSKPIDKLADEICQKVRAKYVAFLPAIDDSL